MKALLMIGSLATVLAQDLLYSFQIIRPGATSNHGAGLSAVGRRQLYLLGAQMSSELESLGLTENLDFDSLTEVIIKSSDEARSIESA